MRAPTRLWPAAVIACLAAPAAAFAPAQRPPVELAPALALKAPLRTSVRVTGQVPTARARAWDAFRASAGDHWDASWDAATGVPSRRWGGSL
jgi:hypothetical protein